jgi:phage-related protein
MAREHLAVDEKPLIWVGSSKKDLMTFPAEVQADLGAALGTAQFGGKHPDAKPWRGEGPGVMEVVEDHRGDTFRAVYKVRFAEAVFVLHTFQKKSKSGIKTPKAEQDLIASRLKDAEWIYRKMFGGQRG